MWHKERSLWVLERKLYYGFPVPGVVASVGSGGTPLSEGDSGLVIATAGANVNDGGSTAWSNPGNITVSDALWASCFRSSTGTSQLLKATFDFATGDLVPVGATIAGVVVRVRRNYSSSVPPQQIRDHTLRLTKDGTNMVGDNKGATSTDWPLSSDANVDYGGASDLWGTTLSAAEVRTSTFGVMLKVAHTGTTSLNPRVNAIWMTVHYLI